MGPTASIGKDDLEAGASETLGAEAAVELRVDLSKRGATTELAAFGAQTGILASQPGVVASLVTGIEQLPGVNLPGEPVDYIQKHLSAVEASGKNQLSEQLSAILGPSVTATFSQYAKQGGRLEYNPDGSFTVKSSVALGTSAGANVGSEADGLGVGLQIADGSVETSFDSSVTIQPGPPRREIDLGYTATLKMDGQLDGSGAEARLSIDLQKLPLGPFRDQVLGALRRGDLSGAKQALQNALGKTQLTGTLEVQPMRTTSEDVSVDSGIDLDVEAKRTTLGPPSSLAVTLGADGITVNGTLGGRNLVNETLTPDELKKLIQSPGAYSPPSRGAANTRSGAHAPFSSAVEERSQSRGLAVESPRGFRNRAVYRL